MRYTEKVKRTPIYDCDYVSKVEEKGLLDKLGQLEDIEDRLGIDLITYHKLMSKLYCGDGDRVFYEGKEAIIYEIDYCKKKVILLSPEDEREIVVGFGSYGKTWALTKKELPRR